jgi:hypothetical protein
VAADAEEAAAGRVAEAGGGVSAPGRKASVEKLAFIGGNVPEDLKERFEAVAKANNRDKAKELRVALRAHVEAHERSAA